MKIIKHIDNIIISLLWEEKQKRMKIEFFKFAKKWKVKKFNLKEAKNWESDEDIKNREKYKKYDSTSIENEKLKKDFFEKLYYDNNCFCYYCWKDRITYFKEKDWKTKRLYDIEHFLPRSKFPDLSVNLYNWLPVCMSCNQRLKKAENPLDKNEIFHPYFWFLDSSWIIKSQKSLDKKYSFEKDDYKNRENIYDSEHSKFFKLKEIYLNSQDTFNIFDFIHDKETKIKDERYKFKKNKKSDKQLKDYFFKNYYPEKEEDIFKYSNWKFKKDLIENLKI